MLVALNVSAFFSSAPYFLLSVAKEDFASVSTLIFGKTQKSCCPLTLGCQKLVPVEHETFIVLGTRISVTFCKTPKS